MIAAEAVAYRRNELNWAECQYHGPTRNVQEVPDRILVACFDQIWAEEMGDQCEEDRNENKCYSERGTQHLLFSQFAMWIVCGLTLISADSA